jgi:hypothetical protein
LAQAVLNEDEEDFGLECLGILGNLTIPDLDYELILKEYNMIPWIKNRLEPGMVYCSTLAFHNIQRRFSAFSSYVSLTRYSPLNILLKYHFFILIVCIHHLFSVFSPFVECAFTIC